MSFRTIPTRTAPSAVTIPLSAVSHHTSTTRVPTGVFGLVQRGISNRDQIPGPPTAVVDPLRSSLNPRRPRSAITRLSETARSVP
jgi:hypothetical protein